MTNRIQIKRSSVTAIPASLTEGELAYSEKTGVKLLYIGTNSGSSIEAIGGKAVYDHSVSPHAPIDAQKNSDILKSEIEAVLTGEITTHSHPAGSTFFNQLNGSVPPTASNDTGEGYSVGSIWIDKVNEETYRCIDNTLSAAIWIQTSLTTDELSALAISGSADDLSDGTTNKVFLSTERTKLTNIEDNAEVNNISDVNATLLTGGSNTTLHTHTEMIIDGGTY